MTKKRKIIKQITRLQQIEEEKERKKQEFKYQFVLKMEMIHV